MEQVYRFLKWVITYAFYTCEFAFKEIGWTLSSHRGYHDTIKLWSQWSYNEHMKVCLMLDAGCEYQCDVNLKVY